MTAPIPVACVTSTQSTGCSGVPIHEKGASCALVGYEPRLLDDSVHIIPTYQIYNTIERDILLYIGDFEADRAKLPRLQGNLFRVGSYVRMYSSTCTHMGRGVFDTEP